MEQSPWQGDGDRSAAEWMARRSGTTGGRAKAALETSRRLAELPATDQALARGTLSGPQAEAITEAASADPSSESRLLETAERRGLRELREDCARTKARAEDATERAARLHRQRCLRTWKGSDGSWNLSLRNTPEAGADIEAALAPLRDQIFHSARRAGRAEPTEAYAADALSELVRLGASAQEAEHANDAGANDAGAEPGHDGPDPQGPSDEEGRPRWTKRSRRPDTKVIVLIDYEALRRGHAQAGETCEIAGVGPIPVASARSLMADAFGAVIVTNGVDVFTVAHLGRSVSAHQRSALEARGYRCEVPGCGATRALEIDHIEDWHLTWRTQLDRLGLAVPGPPPRQDPPGLAPGGTTGRPAMDGGRHPSGPDPPPANPATEPRPLRGTSGVSSAA